MIALDFRRYRVPRTALSVIIGIAVLAVGVASLNHESVDDAVKGGSIVEPFGREFFEIGDVLPCVLFIKIYRYRAHGRLDHGNLFLDFHKRWNFLLLTAGHNAHRYDQTQKAPHGPVIELEQGYLLSYVDKKLNRKNRVNIAGPFVFVQLICLSASCAAQEIRVELKSAQLLTSAPEVSNPVAFCMGVDRSVFVADAGRERIVRLDSTGNVITQVGRLGFRDDEFDGLLDLHTSDGLNLYAVDSRNRRIQRYGRRLNLVASVRNADVARGSYDKSSVFLKLGWPVALAVSPLGDLFIVDDQLGEIVRINRQARVDLRFGGVSAHAGRLRKPHRIASSTTLVAVADEEGVALYDYFGSFLRRVDNSHGRPRDVAIDRRNRLWILYASVWTCVDETGKALGSWSNDQDGIAVEADTDVFVLAPHPIRVLTYTVLTP